MSSSALASYLILGALGVVVPFALAPVFRRRWPSSYWVFVVGAVTFGASQVVHVPLLFALSLANGPLSQLPLPLVQVLSAVILGLAAALCEEWARYVAFRWALPKSRSFSDSLMHGLGHGGIEAVFFVGIMSLATALSAWALTRAGAEALASTPEEQAAIVAAMRDLASMTPTKAMWGVVERGIVIPFHIAESVLVAYAVRRSKTRFVWLAVLMHAVLDFVAAYAGHLDAAPPWAIELALAAVTVVTIGMVAKLPGLRDPEPSEGAT